jgi:hypothetical protein
MIESIDLWINMTANSATLVAIVLAIRAYHRVRNRFRAEREYKFLDDLYTITNRLFRFSLSIKAGTRVDGHAIAQSGHDLKNHFHDNRYRLAQQERSFLEQLVNSAEDAAGTLIKSGGHAPEILNLRNAIEEKLQQLSDQLRD